MAGNAEELGIMADLWRATRGGPRALASLVAHARTSSPFYRQLYRGLPAEGVRLRDLPPVTKPQLMDRFDDWVTDSAVTRADLEAFVADPALSGPRTAPSGGPCLEREGIRAIGHGELENPDAVGALTSSWQQ